MKTLQELTLFDRFLFNETMEIPEAHEAVLRIILGDEKIKAFISGTDRKRDADSTVASIYTSGHVFNGSGQDDLQYGISEASQYRFD